MLRRGPACVQCAKYRLARQQSGRDGAYFAWQAGLHPSQFMEGRLWGVLHQDGVVMARKRREEEEELKIEEPEEEAAEAEERQEEALDAEEPVNIEEPADDDRGADEPPEDEEEADAPP